jgi:hypothetical protein
VEAHPVSLIVSSLPHDRAGKIIFHADPSPGAVTLVSAITHQCTPTIPKLKKLWDTLADLEIRADNFDSFAPGTSKIAPPRRAHLRISDSLVARHSSSIMADVPAAPTANGEPSATDVAGGVAKLYLDDATGEMVSKTELKKRQKAREKEATKKEKQAAKNQEQTSRSQPSKRDAEAGEKDLTPNQVRLKLSTIDLRDGEDD